MRPRGMSYPWLLTLAALGACRPAHVRARLCHQIQGLDRIHLRPDVVGKPRVERPHLLVQPDDVFLQRRDGCIGEVWRADRVDEQIDRDFQ